MHVFVICRNSLIAMTAVAVGVPIAAASPSPEIVHDSGSQAALAGVGSRFPIGSSALIDVSVATLWREPRIHRRLDVPSLADPVKLGKWNRQLRTAAQRRWLVGQVQTQALYGQQVLVREVRGNWIKVAVVDQPEPQDPAGYPGWLPARQLIPKGDMPQIVDDSEHLVVRAKKTRLQTPTGKVAVGYGTRLLPTSPQSGSKWIEVETPRGPGRIKSAAVSEPMELTARSVLREGRRFMGLRYLWGGLSAWGMDCSGLLWNVFRAHGKTIPRDADPQFRAGGTVSLKKMKPGDFIFWGSQDYAHHVAIYVGKNKMLEAPDSSGRVRVVPVRWNEVSGSRRFIR